VSVSIALPGTPGESVDWLDILRRDGVGAVRAGILEAMPFEQPLSETDGQSAALAPDVAADMDRVHEAAARLAAMPDAAREMRLKAEAALLGVGVRVLNREIQAVLSKHRQDKKKAEGGDREPAWQDDLILGVDGEPRAVLANALTAIRGANVWDGVLGFDDFAKQTVFRKPPPWHRGHWNGDREVSDRDIFLATEWVQHQGIACPSMIVGQAIETISQGYLFHPVREYLDNLVWDGTSRIDAWLSEHLGVVDNDYTQAVAAKMLIGSVARIFKPLRLPS